MVVALMAPEIWMSRLGVAWGRIWLASLQGHSFGYIEVHIQFLVPLESLLKEHALTPQHLVQHVPVPRVVPLQACATQLANLKCRYLAILPSADGLRGTAGKVLTRAFQRAYSRPIWRPAAQVMGI